MEVWRQYLPTELNLNRELEQLIKVCPSQDSEERSVMEQGKNKRSSEQQKGDRLKKPYGKLKIPFQM